MVLLFPPIVFNHGSSNKSFAVNVEYVSLNRMLFCSTETVSNIRLKKTTHSLEKLVVKLGNVEC